MSSPKCDVVVIGAGPAGSVAAALLSQRGYQVLVLERQHFPRFSIGESLLAYSTELLMEAGMLEAVLSAGFQFKNGATFVCDDQYSEFNFADKLTAGCSFTFQVLRSEFDHLLATEAEFWGEVGWEELRVPAGKFRAVKIETQGTWQRLDLNLEGTARFVIWYVPELRRWAKFMYEDSARIASQLKPGLRLVDELVGFKLQ